MIYLGWFGRCLYTIGDDLTLNKNVNLKKSYFVEKQTH